jgi:hypothetical protein
MMEVCWFSNEVSPMEEHRYQKEPGWMEAMRSRAASALAHLILKDGKALFRRIEPTQAELDRNPLANIKYQWSVGVESSLDEIKAREKQIDEARQRGRAEAPAICLEAAKRYQNLREDGMCKWVIASALEDAAKVIQQS